MSALIPEEAESEPTHDEEEVRRAMASPGLNQFRRNPFRVLRLPAAATSRQAVWKAEKALALTRAGMPLPGADRIPWLPEADELDIQQAAQAMEEPLSRLCEQLLWFDIDADPSGDGLRRALQGDDAEEILRLIEARDAEPPANPGAPAGSGDIAAMARRIHDANFRLLLAFSMLHEVGPGATTDLPAEEAGEPKEPPAWRTKHGLSCIEGAHALFAPDPDGAASACVRLLREALAGWAGIFGDPRWGGYLQYQIARLDDELVSGEDAEALTNAVAMRVVDLVAGELKLVTLSGRLDRTVELVRAAVWSGVGPHVWQKAFRGLRYVFRAELDEIMGLLSEGGAEGLEDARIHVARLAALAARWKDLDEAGLLGLAPLVDEGAVQAFERLCAIHHAALPAERIAQHERVLEALADVRSIARSPSLRERIDAFSEKVRGVTSTVCHFCMKRDPSGYPTVLEGVSNMGQTREGNVITRRYQIRRAVVQRCERCADLHEYIRTCRLALLAGVWMSALTSLFIRAPLEFVVFIIVNSAILFSVACFFIGVYLQRIGPFIDDIVARFVTPRGERRINDIEGSAGYTYVRCADYINILSGKNAVAKLRG